MTRRQLRTLITGITTVVAAVAVLWTQFNLPATLIEGEPAHSLPSPVPSGVPQRQLGVSQELEIATVAAVVDGDTIKLQDGRTVRYIGIDTPETKHPTKAKQCFGKEASEHNKQLVFGQTVELEKDVSETDRYGRLLRYVWLNGQLVNALLVRDGYAHAASFPPDLKYQSQFATLAVEAQQAGRGLWTSCSPAP